MSATTRAPEAIWAFTEHEHRDLVRGINEIHDVACAIGVRPRPEAAVRILDVLHWLDAELEPHIRWEESWLYPEIDKRTGTPWATRAAQFDHQQIREAAGRVRADRDALAARDAMPIGDRLIEARCHLFGLEALVRAHIEREERFLIPLLTSPPE